jgi:hypothetical protein
MPILKTRRRMVSLRLSEDEYQDLVKLSVTEGAHSTSDLARAALSEFMMKQRSGEGAGRIPQRVELLENEVRRINRVLETITTVAKTQV